MACQGLCVQRWSVIQRAATSTFSAIAAGNDRHSTHKTAKGKVAYRWHPLFGKKVPVIRRTLVEGKEYVHIEMRGNFSRELPSWMLDDAICSRMDTGAPRLSIDGLRELAEVLRADLVALPSVSKAKSGHEEKSNHSTGTKACTATLVCRGNGTSSNSSRGPRRSTQRGRRIAAGGHAAKRKGGSR
jgi:hypothetical protein